ncbi:MAG: Hsp70 family protein, partial [Erysipelotrichales bacterium]
NGIVSVKAKDLGTNKEQSITITSDHGLSDEDIEKMVQDAELHKEEDEKRKEEIETKNKAEQLIYQIDKTLEDGKENIDEAQKEETLKLRDDLQKALDEGNIEELKEKIDALEKAMHEVASQMYAQQEGAAPAGEENASAQDDDVVDADFEEKK